MMCDKIKYDSYKDAQGHLTGLRQRVGKDKYYAYKCPECGSFHVATRHKNKLERPIKEQKYKKIEILIPKHPKPKQKPSKPLPPREQPIISTGKIMSDEQARFLKQLLNSEQKAQECDASKAQ